MLNTLLPLFLCSCSIPCSLGPPTPPSPGAPTVFWYPPLLVPAVPTLGNCPDRFYYGTLIILGALLLLSSSSTLILCIKQGGKMQPIAWGGSCQEAVAQLGISCRHRAGWYYGTSVCKAALVNIVARQQKKRVTQKRVSATTRCVCFQCCAAGTVLKGHRAFQ